MGEGDGMARGAEPAGRQHLGPFLPQPLHPESDRGAAGQEGERERSREASGGGVGTRNTPEEGVGEAETEMVRG